MNDGNLREADRRRFGASARCRSNCARCSSRRSFTSPRHHPVRRPEGSGKKAALRHSRPRSTRAISPSTNAASTGAKPGTGIGWRHSGAASGRGRIRRSSTAAGTGASRRPSARPHRREGWCRAAFDEINEFEAQQRDHGTLIVKLFFDVSAEAQRAPSRSAAGRSLAPGPPASCRSRRAIRPICRALAELKAHTTRAGRRGR